MQANILGLKTNYQRTVLFFSKLNQNDLTKSV